MLEPTPWHGNPQNEDNPKGALRNFVFGPHSHVDAVKVMWVDPTSPGRTLDSWRNHAEITSELGHRGYRDWLADVERRARTGEPTPGAVTWSQLKAELGI